MKEIPLTQGKVALVDDEDYERAMRHKWFAHKEHRTYYACRNVVQRGGSRGIQYLHNFILGILGVDHKDGNGLNDWRLNLRAATQQQNCFSHRRKKNGASSEFRGVSWVKDRQKWTAHIQINRQQKNLGNFLCEVSAARAYDVAARELFGEFATPNFPA